MDFDKELKKIENIEKRSCENANSITVQAGSTGPQGGDWGHGSRAYVSIADDAGTAWTLRIDGEVFDSPRKIELLFGGDAELETFREAFEFISKYIK